MIVRCMAGPSAVGRFEADRLRAVSGWRAMNPPKREVLRAEFD